MVFVGDYVDRGPDSKGVVDTILELADHCNVVTLMGNHEQMLLGYLEDPFSHVAGMFIYNGGSATLESYSDGHGPSVSCVPRVRYCFSRSRPPALLRSCP